MHRSGHCVVLSGCSGGGKSTLLAELAGRGFATVEEPGRRIVKDEMASGGSALPWIDMIAFARRALDLATADRTAVEGKAGPVFFDRGWVDAAGALEHFAGEPAEETAKTAPPYCSTVFMTPPWLEIYAGDTQRRHGFDEAVAEHERLMQLYPRLGYTPVLLPKTAVPDRADFILARLKITAP
ncbi:AAA family ATPase [Radicibacter daui]|uniref:AAA family ATPase n=1 Tax=Radicibacter daui TaxID=3064829 RepID=UPI004046BFCC